MKNIFVFGGSRGIGSVFVKRALESKRYNITLFSRTNRYDFPVAFHSVDFCNKACLETIARVANGSSVDGVVFFQKFRGGFAYSHGEKTDEPLDDWDGEMLVELEFIKNAIEVLSNKSGGGGRISSL